MILVFHSGDVLTANLSVISQQALERGAGRIWQGDRKNGANTLTISGGHAIDGLCYILGEFDELAARVTTRIQAWKSTETGQDVPVDSPDNLSVAGVLKSGAEERGVDWIDGVTNPLLDG